MLLTIMEALKRTGRTKSGLAQALGVSSSAVSSLLSGQRAIKVDELQKIVDYLGLDLVPIVGHITHGGAIEPVTAVELVRVPMPQGSYGKSAAVAELRAYEVRGDAMMPRYDSGDAVVVWAEQRKPLHSFNGQEAVVRCEDGQQWLRYIERDNGRGKFVTLTTFNARPIRNARIAWVGEIYLTVRSSQRATARRKRQRR